MLVATASQQLGAEGTGWTVRLYTLLAGEAAFKLHSLPAGVRGLKARPSRDVWNRRTYLSGQFSRLLVLNEYRDLQAGGLLAPRVAPTLVAAGTGRTGEMVARLVFTCKRGNQVLQRSNPGPASLTLSLTNQGATWSGIPTKAPDPRTTHVEGYISMDGEVSFRAWERTLGVTSVTEGVSSAFLAASVNLPVITQPDNTTVDDTAARGVPPYATAMIVWHRRGWYLDPTRAGIVYSMLDEVESVNAENFIETLDGDFPTAVAFLDDELVLFTQRQTYAIQGWGTSDLRIRKISSAFGCINHHGIKTIRGVLFFPSEEGIAAYFGGGTFKNLMAYSRRGDWIREYENNPYAYQAGCALHDRRTGHYIYSVAGVPTTGATTWGWVGYYRPMFDFGEQEPWWMTDAQARYVSAMGETFGTGSKLGTLLYGADDGWIRQESENDGTDDADVLLKPFAVQHKHFFFGDQGGDRSHGRTATDIGIFIDLKDPALLNDVSVVGYGGDEVAPDASSPWNAVVGPLPAGPSRPTSFALKPLGLSGKGFTIRVEGDSLVGVEYRGMSIDHKEGPQVLQRA